MMLHYITWRAGTAPRFWTGSNVCKHYWWQTDRQTCKIILICDVDVSSLLSTTLTWSLMDRIIIRLQMLQSILQEVMNISAGPARIQHNDAWSCTVLHGPARTRLNHAQSSAVLHSPVWSCTVLHESDRALHGPARTETRNLCCTAICKWKMHCTQDDTNTETMGLLMMSVTCLV